MYPRSSLSRLAGSLLLPAITLLLAPATSPAVSRSYDGASGGLWGTATNWSGDVLPGVGDDVTLSTSVPALASVTVQLSTFAYTLGTALNSLTINPTGTTTSFTLSATNASGAMYAGTLNLGTSATGASYVQAAGLTNVSSALNLGLNSGSGGNYSLSGAGTLTALNATIGGAGLGSFTQSGGTANFTGSLVIGDTNTVATSNYQQSGGTLNLTSGADLTVGNFGRGSFTLSGGTLNLSSTLSQIVVTATATTFNNTFTLSGTGNLTGTGSVSVGEAGTGTFNQTGGTITFGTTGFVTLGGSGGTGTYTMSGGNLTANRVVLGTAASGVGSFTQSAGSVALSGTTGGLIVGQANTGAVSTYDLTGGTLGLGGGTTTLTVGAAGRGAFNQSGGTLSLSSGAQLLVATVANAFTQTFTLSGTGQITDVTKISVGQSGTGTFTMSGTATLILGAGGTIFVGENATGVGTFQLNGGSLTTANFNVGSAAGGTGTLNLAGGVLNLTGGTALTVASTGTVNQTGGGISANAVNYLVSGPSASVFQSGGSTVVNNGARLSLAENTAGGYYELSGTGTLTLGNNATLVVGRNQADASFFMTGGQILLSGTNQTIVVGQNAGGVGTFTLGSGTGVGSIATGSIVLGQDGTGSFSQSGSSVVSVTSLRLGVNAGGTGSLQLAGGTVNLSGSFGAMTVGEAGSGNATLSGGSLVFSSSTSTLFLGGVVNGATNNALTLNSASSSITGLNSFNVANGSNTGATVTHSNGSITLRAGGTLQLGAGTGAQGQYNLSGPAATSLLDAPSIIVGLSGQGTFAQSGGTLTSNIMTLGFLASGTGSFQLTGGQLNAGTLNLGVLGTGNYSQPSGNGVAQIGTLSLANSSGTGSVAIGAGTFNVTSSLTVGSSGAGSLSLTGGAMNVTGSLSIGLLGTSNGQFLISGGTYNQPTGSASVGATQAGGTGTLTLQGGSATFGVTLAVGTNAGTGSLALSGGTLSVPAISGGGLLVGANGTFNQTGGSVLGDFTNQGSYSYTAGTLTTFTNSGAVHLNGLLNVTGSLANTTALAIPSGTGVFVGSGGFSNTGDLQLSGGLIGGNGTLTNQGTLTGYGTIFSNGGFVNQGLVQQGAGTLALSNSAANFNQGTILLATGRIFQLGNSTLTNSASLQLNGAFVAGSGIGTLANVAGGVIAGPGTVQSQLSNAGTLQPGAGTLSVVPGFTNAGLVQLTGFTSNLTGGTIVNNGTIQGLGTVANPVTNQGVIEAIGGTLALSGSLTLNAAGSLLAGVGGKILLTAAPAGANAGLINLTGGTFDTNGQALTNGNAGQISGWGSFRTGGAGLTNNGSITFTGGQTTVNGAVTNNAGRTLRVLYNPATFTGNVTNNGTFQVTQTTVTFAGTFTNNGSLVTNSIVQADRVILAPGSSFQGDVGSALAVAGDLLNLAPAGDGSRFDLSQIRFTGGAHQLVWGSVDRGATAAGFASNLVIGTIALDSGASLTLQNTNPRLPGALYVHTLELAGGLAQLGLLSTGGQNVYYDAGALGNAYLGAQIHDLPGGGQLIPTHGVPEPSTWALLGAAAACCAFRRALRRRA